MKRSIALLLVTSLCLSTIVGCGKKEETAVEPPETTLSLKDNTEDIYAVQNEESSTVEKEITDNEETIVTEESTTIDKDYTEERVLNALDAKNGIELSYEKENTGYNIGLKQTDNDLAYMYMNLQRGFDDGSINKSGFFIEGDDIYIYIGDATTNFIEHHLTNIQDDDTVNGLEDSGSMDSFLVDKDKIKSIELKETREYEGAEYDVVAIYTTEHEEEIKELEDYISELKENNSDGGTITSTINGETTTMTLLESYEQRLETLTKPICYYFNTETGEVDYIEITDDTEGTQIAKVKTNFDYERPSWLDKAEVIDSSKDMEIFGELLIVMLLPIADEPITKETLDEAKDTPFGFGSMPMDEDSDTIGLEMESESDL